MPPCACPLRLEDGAGVLVRPRSKLGGTSLHGRVVFGRVAILGECASMGLDLMGVARAGHDGVAALEAEAASGVRCG